MNSYGTVIEDAFATVSLAIVIAVLCVAAGGMAVAGLNMSLFYNTVGEIITAAGIIGAVGFGIWIYKVFSDNGNFGGYSGI
jgi:ABC-type spermidine/putrescine transport system permease subunit II